MIDTRDTGFIYDHFGTNLTTVRQFLGLSIVDFAAFIGVSENILHKWEKISLEISAPFNTMLPTRCTGINPSIAQFTNLRQKFNISIDVWLYVDLSAELPMHSPAALNDYDSLPSYLHRLYSLRDHFTKQKARHGNRRH